MRRIPLSQLSRGACCPHSSHTLPFLQPMPAAKRTARGANNNQISRLRSQHCRSLHYISKCTLLNRVNTKHLKYEKIVAGLRKALTFKVSPEGSDGHCGSFISSQPRIVGSSRYSILVMVFTLVNTACQKRDTE